MGPNSNMTSIINKGAAKGRSHEFESPKEVELLMLDADSRMLWTFCRTCPDLLHKATLSLEAQTCSPR